MDARFERRMFLKGTAAGGPGAGFEYAFGKGADYIWVGMFDFQVAEDAAIARQILDGLSAALQ